MAREAIITPDLRRLYGAKLVLSRPQNCELSHDCNSSASVAALSADNIRLMGGNPFGQNVKTLSPRSDFETESAGLVATITSVSFSSAGSAVIPSKTAARKLRASGRGRKNCAARSSCFSSMHSLPSVTAIPNDNSEVICGPRVSRFHLGAFKLKRKRGAFALGALLAVLFYAVSLLTRIL